MLIWAVKTILGCRRAGLLRLRRAKRPMRLECLGDECGLCCRVMGGPEIDPVEIGGMGELHVINQERVGCRVKAIDGECTLLDGRSCSVYPVRPRACREYPWYNIDGELYYDFGCPGIRFDVDGRPGVTDLLPAQKYFRMFPRWSRALILRILTLW